MTLKLSSHLWFFKGSEDRKIIYDKLIELYKIREVQSLWFSYSG